MPVLWTANALGPVDSAVLRRMAAIVDQPVPPIQVRERLLRQAAEAQGLALEGADALSLARKVPAAPALPGSALRAGRMAGGGVAELRWALHGVARAMNDGVLPQAGLPLEGFDAALVSADTDLATLMRALAAEASAKGMRGRVVGFRA